MDDRIHQIQAQITALEDNFQMAVEEQQAHLAHSSDVVTKRHYEHGTRKVEPLQKKY